MGRAKSTKTLKEAIEPNSSVKRALVVCARGTQACMLGRCKPTGVATGMHGLVAPGHERLGLGMWTGFYGESPGL